MELAGPEPELQSGEELPDPYLAGFSKTGRQTFLYTPTVPERIETTGKVIQPDLIIICSWMGAQSRYIRKYMTPYQTIFPRSSILLLRTDGSDLFWRTERQQVKNLEPAVSAMRQLVDQKRPNKPRVLVHIFSNGGSYTACQLADAYLDALPGKDELLPISALILDSTPSLPSAQRAHTAICESLPKSGPGRFVGSAAVWGYIGLAKAIEAVIGKEDITTSLRRRLNDPNGAFTQGTLKRMYIYSQADELIPASDVEAHARAASSTIGWFRVQLEDFVSSRHVGHVMSDGPRYWILVGNLWKESVG
ncbi:hypothetical protein PV11_03379 [Exophiala sideris]|uniref:Indole-diterpene biosynthesis protein PaxU n=1 Tax=Exophiala sideris TaxID=1016849 RepID=A0A0D1XI45_9EURO|nr:hypothetical protein PV11_03379 [Exophiala sideris]